MSTTIQQTRYDRLLRRVAAMIGPDAKVGEVIPDLMPTLDVESVPMELLLPMGTKTGFGSTTLTSGAGNRSRSQIFNPLESGVLATVTTVMLSSLKAQLIGMNIDPVQIGGVPFIRKTRDLRQAIIGNTVCTIQAENGGSTTNELAFRVEAGVTFVIQDPNGIAVLGPGSGLEFATFSLQSTLDVSYFWRERVAQLSELSVRSA